MTDIKKGLLKLVTDLVKDDNIKDTKEFKDLFNKIISHKSREIVKEWTNEKVFPDNGNRYHEEDNQDVDRMKGAFDIWDFIKKSKNPTTGELMWTLFDKRGKELVWFHQKPTKELLRSYVEKNKNAFNLNRKENKLPNTDKKGVWTNEKLFPDNGDEYHSEDDASVRKYHKDPYKDWNKSGVKDVPELKLTESKKDDDFDVMDFVRKVTNPKTGKKEWALVSDKDGRHLAYHPGDKPTREWADKQVRRIKYFKNK